MHVPSSSGRPCTATRTTSATDDDCGSCALKDGENSLGHRETWIDIDTQKRLTTRGKTHIKIQHARRSTDVKAFSLVMVSWR